MGQQLEQQVSLNQRAEHFGVGKRRLHASHRADPTETWSSHLPVENFDGLCHRVGPRETADDDVGPTTGLSVAVELDGFLD